jgi:hypothetical protein
MIMGFLSHILHKQCSGSVENAAIYQIFTMVQRHLARKKVAAMQPLVMT